jgi:hypothetical protein
LILGLSSILIDKGLSVEMDIEYYITAFYPFHDVYLEHGASPLMVATGATSRREIICTVTQKRKCKADGV